MNKKIIYKITTILVSVIILAVMSPSFAEANNHMDKAWTFQIGSYGKGAYIATYGREKQDATSVYIKCDSCTTASNSIGNSFLATAHGSNNPNNGFFNCSYNGKQSQTYTIRNGSIYKMINYINEAGYGYANIWCYAPYNANLTFTGVWSPDSI